MSNHLHTTTNSILTPADIKHLEKLTEGTSGYFGKVLMYIEELTQKGIRNHQYTQEDVDHDVTLALWESYAYINLNGYFNYYLSMKRLEKCQRQVTNQGTWFYRYAISLRFCGYPEKALLIAEKGVKKAPEYPWTYLVLAKLRSHFGDKEGALQAIANGLKIVPDDYEFLTLQQEVEMGASIEQMELHYIDPDSDNLFQNGYYQDDEKVQDTFCICLNEEGLERWHEIFSPDPQTYEANNPYCTFTMPIQGHKISICFAMNEAGISKLDAQWLRTQKERLDRGIWLTRTIQNSRDVPCQLILVRFCLDRTIELVYQSLKRSSDKFICRLDPQGNCIDRQPLRKNVDSILSIPCH